MNEKTKMTRDLLKSLLFRQITELAENWNNEEWIKKRWKDKLYHTEKDIIN